jgi:hypothetical protein
MICRPTRSVGAWEPDAAGVESQTVPQVLRVGGRLVVYGADDLIAGFGDQGWTGCHPTKRPAGNRPHPPASPAPIKNLAPTLRFAAKPSLQFIAITPVS